MSAHDEPAATTVRVPGIPGFRFSAVDAGVRGSGDRLDLALAVCDTSATVAGLFTRNLVTAAPVQVCMQRIMGGRARAVLVNSGNANACAGEAGMRSCVATSGALADALGLPHEQVLPCSTGVIGVPLPTNKIVAAIPRLVRLLSPDGALAFSQAILTTDRWTKISSTEVQGARVLAIAKGAGMIHPDMGPPHATMLAYFFTDAVVDPQELRAALAGAVDRTFNACTVDGDTSTNDTVLALASGMSGQRPTAAALEEALEFCGGELARAMVADGEGATLVAEIRVRGLATNEDARQVARAVATSLLVKTALHGRDVNWGRFLAAAGRAGVTFDPQRVSMYVGGVPVLKRGVPAGEAAEEKANRYLSGRASAAIELSLGDGPGTFTYFTSDLGHGYVDVNASYRS